MKDESLCYPFRFSDMGSGNWVLYQKFVHFLGTLWFSAYFLPLFVFLKTYFFRKGDSNHSVKNNGKSSDFVEPKPLLELKSDSGGKEEAATDGSNGFAEEGRDGFSFTFKFPSYEEFSKNRRENGDFVFSEAIAKSYEEPFAVSCVEEPKVVSFNESDDEVTVVHEEGPEGSTSGPSSVDLDEKAETILIPFTEDGQNILHGVFNEEVQKGSTSGSCSGNSQEICETTPITFTAESEQTVGEQKSLHDDKESPDDHEESKALLETTLIPFTEENEQTVGGHKVLHGDQEADDEVHLPDFSDMDSDSRSFTSSALQSVMNRLIDSYSDGFLSDRDFGGEFEADLDINEEKGEEESPNDGMGKSTETHVNRPSDDASDKDEDEEETYTMEELGIIEQAHLKAVANLKSNFLSEKDFTDKSVEAEGNEESNVKDNKLKSIQHWDSEDSNQLETLWEHQELIEQLKMELKKVRATGLPTILEDSDESPKIMEDLKPWKINEKFHHVDRVSELHKFYKSYRERMRKFDILNYQKMYAIGFLQLKDPLQSISRKNSSVPSAESILSQNPWLPKSKKIGNDPMLKFLRELQCEVEVVYVGQMCLSWEILHWQYEKSLELWESDTHGIRRFNEVAGEFQQFQVLAQRFVEDEAFQGPRVQTYVKSRCVYKSLLQVPVIREDSAKDRKKAIKSDYVITSDMLVEIMEESIRIFWRFVRADKDCSSSALKSRKAPCVELQDPADSDLLVEVQENLVKKEKKLKDLLRSGNCILKKFRKCQEEDTDHVLYFFSQVDMKLVGRVLNMSRITTEQLLWCRNKLSRISFVNRKLQVEPSFLLFPC